MGSFSMMGRWAFWEDKGDGFSPSFLRSISLGVDSDKPESDRSLTGVRSPASGI